MRVRPARLDDLDALVELEQVCFPLDPWSPNLVGQGIAATLPTVDWLVADAPGMVLAGYAVVSVVDTDAELQRIGVDVSRRRSGLASSLLTAVIAHARAGGADRLLLEVREDNDPARAFYDRHGFSELGRRPRYYRDGATALVLARPLPAATPPDTMEA